VDGFFWKTVKQEIYISLKKIHGINSIIWKLYHKSEGGKDFQPHIPRE
jgi:hypothetical protein